MTLRKEDHAFNRLAEGCISAHRQLWFIELKGVREVPSDDTHTAASSRRVGCLTHYFVGCLTHYFIFFNGGVILVNDYLRMEVTLVGASWDVVAGDRDGCIWQE